MNVWILSLPSVEELEGVLNNSETLFWDVWTDKLNELCVGNMLIFVDVVRVVDCTKLLGCEEYAELAQEFLKFSFV